MVDFTKPICQIFNPQLAQALTFDFFEDKAIGNSVDLRPTLFLIVSLHAFLSIQVPSSALPLLTPQMLGLSFLQRP